jgi:bacillolysin
MRRVLFTIAITFGLVAWHPMPRGGMVVTGQAGQVQALTIAPLTRDGVLDWDNTIARMVTTDELRVRLDREESLLPGRTIQQLEQYSKGLRVWEAGVSRQLDGPTAVSVFGQLYVDPNIDVTPTLTETEARAAIEFLGTLLGERHQLELVILPLEDAFHLAWVADIATSNDVLRVFLDANSGEIIRQDGLLQSQLPPTAYVGHGRGVLGDDKKISTAPLAGGFAAYDTIRKPEISTYNLRSNQVRADFIQRGLIPPTVSDYATTTSSNDWTDSSVVDAHVYSSYTYDYYAKQFKRSGLDNRNGPIRNMVHTARRSDVFLSSSNDKWFINAEYSSATSVMYYGEGLDFPVDLGGGGGVQRINYLSAALDVVAHELTHGVTDFTSELAYRNESGALNESFSDIIGTSVEFFFQPAGTGLMKADYLIGEDAFTAAATGALNGIRSMENPRLFGQPDHVSSPLRKPSVASPTSANDYGGVHTNSGIPNQAFYLAIEGGTNRTSGIRVQGVGTANRAQIEKVFYHAFADLMRSTANFSTARALTLQAAIDLYGLNSPPYNAVRDAWTAVGAN